MTEHALIRLWQPGPLSLGCAGVAIEALDTGAAVDLVAEGNGLGTDLDREFLDLALVGGLCVGGQGPAADRRHEEREAGRGKLQQVDLSVTPQRQRRNLISFGGLGLIPGAGLVSLSRPKAEPGSPPRPA